MTTLTNNDQSTLNPSLALASTGLSLRVEQPGCDDSMLPLPTGKCTVGSSERCQVHLLGGAVRPLHCLIVHEGNEVVVTRWAPGALLNGQDFATAPFHPGDALQIGEAKLVLVAEAVGPLENQPSPTTQPTAQSTSQPAPAPTVVSNAFAPVAPASPTAESTTASAGKPESPFSETPLPEIQLFETQSAAQPTGLPVPSVVDTREVDRLVARLQLANDSARARCRKLVATLRTMRAEARGFDQRIDELQQQLATALEEREQIFTQLSQLEGEASQRENQSTEEIDRLISELTTAYEKAGTAEAAVAAQVEELDQARAELKQLRAEHDKWEQMRSAGELQRNKLAQALADREAAIETLQAEVEESRDAANRADEYRMENAETLAALQAEHELVRTEKEQLANAQSQSLQYQQEIEQALADSEQNMAVFQLELEKFQLVNRQSDQEAIESKAALEDLQLEFAQLKDERDKLVAKRTEYQLSEQGWEHEIATRETQIATLSQEIEQLRVEIAESNQGVAEQLSQTEGFQQQLDLLTTERDQLLVAQAEQVEIVKAWEEAVASRDQRIQELEEEHDGICQVLQSVEKGAFEQVDSCNKLESQLASIREERDQLVNSLPELQEYIKQLENALGERDEQISLLTEELTKTAQHQTELEGELSAGTSKYQTLEGELAELNSRYEELIATQGTSEQSKAALEQKLQESQDQIAQLQQQIETAEQQRQELERVVADGAQSKESSQATLSELQTQYEQLTADHRAELNRRQELDQQLVEQSQNIELFQVDLKSVRAELDRTVEQVSSLQQERETLNLQLTGLREELAAQEEANKPGDDELKIKHNALVEELAAVREQLEKAQVAVADESSDGNESEYLIAQLETEKSLLQEQVEQQSQQAEQLAAELEQARQSLQTAEQALLEQVTSPTPAAEPAAAEAAEAPVVEDAPWDVASDDDAIETQNSATSAPSKFDESAPVSWDIPLPVEDETDELAAEPIAEVDAKVDDEIDDEDSTESARFEILTKTENDAVPVAKQTDEEGEESEIEAVIENSVPVDTADDVTEVAEESAEVESVETNRSPVESGSLGSTAIAYQTEETESSDEEPVKEFKPASFIEQYQHLLDDDGQTDNEPVQPATPAPVENRLGAEIDATADTHDDDSDEALQDYMANMLARMRGDKNEDKAAPQANEGVVLNQKPDPVEAISDIRENVVQAAPVEDPADLEPMDLEKLKRSSQKPNLPTDLSAMRELANSSARGAIAKHHKRRHLEKALGLFFVCLISICVGVYMLMAGIVAQQFLSFNFLGGAVAILVGAVGGLKLLGLLLLAIREGAWEKKSASKLAKQVTAANKVSDKPLGGQPTKAND